MMIGSLIMVLMVLGSAVPLLFGLAALRGASVETRGIIMTLGFGLLTLGWPLMVTLMTGNNDMLDAGRFALYPVRATRLLPGLLAAAAMGLGGLLTVLMGVGYVAGWSSSPSTVVAAVVGLALGFATCLVTSRALSAVLASVLRRRKARDLVMVVFVVAVLALSLGIQYFSHLLPNDLQQGVTFNLTDIVHSMLPAATAMAWTPFGWAWALPWAVAQGSWGAAAIWLGLAFVWLAFCGWIWGRQFAQSLISPLETGGSSEKIAKANPLDRLMPSTPAGAVAKRDLRYWRRDPRRLIGAIATLIMPFIMAVSIYASSVNQAPDVMALMKAVLAFSPVMVGFMAAISVAYDISYDGSALATQIVTGISGRDDRWGRLLAYLTIFGPIQVVMIIGFVAYSGRWDLLPSVTGCCIAYMGAGAGVGSWMGSIWQIPQPPAGSNLVNRGGTGGVAGFVGTMLGILLPGLLCLPTIAIAVVAVAFGPNPWAWITLAVGLLTAWLLLWWGVRSGGRRLDRKWPEVLAKVTWKG